MHTDAKSHASDHGDAQSAAFLEWWGITVDVITLLEWRRLYEDPVQHAWHIAEYYARFPAMQSSDVLAVPCEELPPPTPFPVDCPSGRQVAPCIKRVKRGSLDGFEVRAIRFGARGYRMFHAHIYEGAERALTAAHHLVAQVEEVWGDRARGSLRGGFASATARARSGSGQAGVFKNKHGHWIATWYFPRGQQNRRHFGPGDSARMAAIACRRAQEEASRRFYAEQAARAAERIDVELPFDCEA